MKFTFTFGARADPPDPVQPPGGWLVEAGDGQIPAVVLHDEFFEDRQSLAQTNEIFPLRPVDPEGFWGRVIRSILGLIGFKTPRAIYSVFGLRVAPTGKIICRLDRMYMWMLWIIDLLGERNAGLLAQPGDGTMDTNAPDTKIDGSDELKMMAAAFGGMVVKVIGSHLQAGQWYDLIETFDYYRQPILGEDGVWRVNGTIYTWETHPYLFWTRVNRVKTKIYSWLTREYINAATDGGELGGKGDEHVPVIACKLAALPRYELYHLPELPVRMTIYCESLVVDGNLVERTGGIEVWVDAYMFYGSDTYVRTVGGKWYLAARMIPRNEPPYPGNGFYWRCYASLDGVYPYVPYRGWSVPVGGWVRKEPA